MTTADSSVIPNAQCDLCGDMGTVVVLDWHSSSIHNAVIPSTAIEPARPVAPLRICGPCGRFAVDEVRSWKSKNNKAAV